MGKAERTFSRSKGVLSPAEGAVVRVEEIGHVYGRGGRQITALKDVSFEAPASEVTVVVGPSGCGKSTLLDIVGGLARPTYGRVLRNGTEVSGPSSEVAMAFQQPALFPWLTVMGNITLGLEARGMRRREARDEVRGLVEMVGLSEFTGSYPHELSGGMAQRVGIARAFAMEPQLLLLDEPFASVDAYTRLTLQRELLQLIKRTLSTVILVTHDINEAVFLADRIIVMGTRPGRVLAAISVEPAEKDRKSAAFASKAAEIMELLGVDTSAF